MCLSIAINAPGRVLARGEHRGFTWLVTNNGYGYRCGYVRVPAGHPWHGRHYDDVGATAHGGLTFSEADVPCDKDGNDDAWWFGFDHAHVNDERDSALPIELDPDGGNLFFRQLSDLLTGHFDRPCRLWTQEEVEAGCRDLCDQAWAAAAGAGR